MQTKIEGILLSKIPNGERHLIGSVLLRNGKKVSVLFYGGRGGGKKQKDSILEVGHMLSVDLVPAKRGVELYKAREWKGLWLHNHIRLNFQAFHLLCFFVEVASKIAREDHLHDPHRDFDENEREIFTIVSNALFYLDKNLANGVFDRSRDALIFLVKLGLVMGVSPSRDYCQLSDSPLGQEDMVLSSAQGGFVSMHALSEEERRLAATGDGRELWKLIGLIASAKYVDIAPFKLSHQGLARQIFQYVCYQFGWSESDFKTGSLVF